MARRGKGLPETLNIAGKPYGIVRDSDRASLQDAMGLCNHNLLQIHLNSSQHPLQLRDTVLHEVLHAISNATDLELTERQVAVLSGQLIDTLDRNPEFTRWLLS